MQSRPGTRTKFSELGWNLKTLPDRAENQATKVSVVDARIAVRRNGLLVEREMNPRQITNSITLRVAGSSHVARALHGRKAVAKNHALEPGALGCLPSGRSLPARI
jgi:hypothetical protein